jgi:hypothetical protein
VRNAETEMQVNLRSGISKGASLLGAVSGLAEPSLSLHRANLILIHPKPKYPTQSNPLLRSSNPQVIIILILKKKVIIILIHGRIS